MISVVIATCNDAQALGRTLAALVPAAVDGLVREVILADAGSTDATLEIAEDAGARVVAGDGPAEARIARACATARSDWLLILDVARPPPAPWAEAAAGHLRGGQDVAAYWGGRRSLFGRAEPASLLIARALLSAVGGYSARLPRALGRRARRLNVG